jgi:hypothetical protein
MTRTTTAEALARWLLGPAWHTWPAVLGFVHWTAIVVAWLPGVVRACHRGLTRCARVRP